MRNVGIVFSPTLGIPAGVFSLMLGEFSRVFAVDDGEAEAAPPAAEGQGAPLAVDRPNGPDRRNSRRYTDAAADKLLGLSGRTLASSSCSLRSSYRLIADPHARLAPAEDDDSDVEISVQYDDSGTETTETHDPSQADSQDTPQTTPVSKGRAASAAATRGLNIATAGEPKKRQSRVAVGLPASPRPGFHPSTFAQQQTGTSPPASPNPARLGV